MKQLFKALPILLLAVVMVAPAVAGDYGDDDDTDNKFSVKGEVRVRGEFAENYADFNDDTADSVDFFPFRVRLAAKAELGSNVWAFGEIQHSELLGRDFKGSFGPIPGVGRSIDSIDYGEAQFYQAWIAVKDVGDTSWSFKVGRQEITQGNELLWGDLDFYNGIPHDGIMNHWDFDSFKLSAWWVRNREDTSFISPGTRDRDHNYYAASAVWDWEDNTELDLYLIWDRDDDKTIVAGVRNADYYTLGGRITHHEKGDGVFNWSAEYAMQTGDVAFGGAEADQDAWVFEGMIGYMWGDEGNLMHNVHVGYTAATGNDPTTTDSEAFRTLFQDFHWRLGLADIFTTTNIEAIEAGYKMMVGDNQKWGATYYTFSYEQAPAAALGEDDLGSELDIWYKYVYSENLTYHVALAQYMAGDVNPFTGVQFGAGPDDDIMRLYGQMKVRW